MSYVLAIVSYVQFSPELTRDLHVLTSLFLSPAPTEANCTYFKFFTTGENARIFQRTTKKGERFSPCGGVVVGIC